MRTTTFFRYHAIFLRQIQWSSMHQLILGTMVGVFIFAHPASASDSIPSEVPAEGKGITGVIAPEFQKPNGFLWGLFTSNLRTHNLRYGYLPASGIPKGTIIIQGGMTEFAEKYFHTMRPMAEDWGYDVWTMDWRGQGKSDRYDPVAYQKLGYQGFDNDAADLVQFVEKVVNPHPDRPLYLIAHSMGTQISLRALHDHPNLFDKVVLSSPLFGVRTGDQPFWLVDMLSSLMTLLGFGDTYLPGDGPWNPDQTYLLEHSNSSQHPVRYVLHQDWYKKDPELIGAGATWGWVNNAIDSAEETFTKAYMSEVALPILIGSAANDHYVDDTRHDVACAEFFPNCTLYKASDAKHEFFQELDRIRDPWMQTIKTFLEQ